MRRFSPPLLASCCLALLAASARADIIQQFTEFDTKCMPTNWFQALDGGLAGPAGHSGVLQLGAMPTPNGTLFSAWLTFSPGGTFLSLVGGTVSSDEILSPSGAPLTDIRGAVILGSGFELDFNTVTATYASPLLYSGVLMWNPGHTYIVLIGGLTTTYEVTAGGAPIPGVRGAARLATQFINTATPPVLAETLFSGTVVYSSSHAWLVRTFSLIAASEILFSGAPITDVRGVTAMGGVANTLLLDTGSILWTPTKVHLLLTGPFADVYEIKDPAGASISGAWSVTRCGPPYMGGGLFLGAATIVDSTREILALASGFTIATYDVPKPGGAPIATNVVVPASNSLLHQASGLWEVFGTWQPPGVPLVRGTVIGALQ
jgi:hypothetical protein